MNPSFLYRLLKVYCSVGLWFYFRKWQVENSRSVPKKGPLIYIANHQNAFIDAILMTCSASRNPHYIARANVFKKKWAAWLLSIVHIKPIYRFRDGYNTLKNNDTILQDCIDLLKKGEVILIFPEGNHNEPWSLSGFQKGFARMASMYRQQTQDNSLKIIPIGIHYTNHHSFNGRVLVRYGNAILASDIMNMYEKEREQEDALVRKSELCIQELALDIKPQVEYRKRVEHFIKNRTIHDDMIEQFHSDRKIISSYPTAINPQTKKKFPVDLILWPIIVLVYLTHTLQYMALRHLIRKKITDHQFINSVKYAVGIFLVPLSYFVFTFLFYVITKNMWASVLFFISMPLSLVIYTKTRKIT